MLIIATTVAAMIISAMVSRDPEDPGFLIQRWDQILRFIGNDKADDVSREEDEAAGGDPSAPAAQ